MGKPKRSLRAAINAMCKQCIYDPKDRGTWRKQVENCSCSGCALYPYRPVSKGSSFDKRFPKQAAEHVVWKPWEVPSVRIKAGVK
jgi:hypothetical protein